MERRKILAAAACVPARGARALIRAYQLSLSSLIGGQCRYLPTCSAYADEAIANYGLWAGGWMGLSRLCRCHPWGPAGFDPVPSGLADDAHWALPWRYGRRASIIPEPPLICEPVEKPVEPWLDLQRPSAQNAMNLDREAAHDRVPGP